MTYPWQVGIMGSLYPRREMTRGMQKQVLVSIGAAVFTYQWKRLQTNILHLPTRGEKRKEITGQGGALFLTMYGAALLESRRCLNDAKMTTEQCRTPLFEKSALETIVQTHDRLKWIAEGEWLSLACLKKAQRRHDEGRVSAQSD